MRRRISISFASDHQRRLHGYNLVGRGVPRRIELQATYLQMGDHFPPIDHGLQVRARNSCRNSCPCLDDALRGMPTLSHRGLGRGRSIATSPADGYRKRHRDRLLSVMPSISKMESKRRFGY